MSDLPDVRDGLTREQRVILWTLRACHRESGGRPVSTAMLYGRVCERLPMSERRFLTLLKGCMSA